MRQYQRDLNTTELEDLEEKPNEFDLNKRLRKKLKQVDSIEEATTELSQEIKNAGLQSFFEPLKGSNPPNGIVIER